MLVLLFSVALSFLRKQGETVSFSLFLQVVSFSCEPSGTGWSCRLGSSRGVFSWWLFGWSQGVSFLPDEWTLLGRCVRAFCALRLVDGGSFRYEGLSQASRLCFTGDRSGWAFDLSRSRGIILFFLPLFFEGSFGSVQAFGAECGSVWILVAPLWSDSRVFSSLEGLVARSAAASSSQRGSSAVPYTC